MKIHAVYEHGVLRPERRLNLKPGTHVWLELIEVDGHPVGAEETEALPELERVVLDEVESNPEGLDLHSILGEVAEWVAVHNQYSDTEIHVEPEETQEAVRSLIDKRCIVAHLPPGESPLAYTLTPRGKAMAVLNRRERWRRRKGKAPKPLPMPKDRDLTFEELSVDHLDLDTRIRKVLKKNRLWTVEALLRETPKELLEIYGLGRKGVEQIEWQLRTICLALAAEEPKDEPLS